MFLVVEVQSKTGLQSGFCRELWLREITPVVRVPCELDINMN